MLASKFSLRDAFLYFYARLVGARFCLFDTKSNRDAWAGPVAQIVCRCLYCFEDLRQACPLVSNVRTARPGILLSERSHGENRVVLG